MSKVSFEQFFYKWTAALLVLAFAVGTAGVPVAHAAGFTVTNLDDSGTGSLRQAILDANGMPGADTITFDLSGTIMLTSTLPTISDAAGLTIDGSGQSITISGNDTVRVMVVNRGVALTVRNLTIANGHVQDFEIGAGIYNQGTLTVENSTFSGNSAPSFDGGYGGGIFNEGMLIVSNSTFSGNSAINSGGGIENQGTLTVENSTFSGNSGNDGAGIGNRYLSTLNVTNSIFSDNGARDVGGSISNNGGTANVVDSTFSRNTAYVGGGIVNSGTLNVTNSTFSGNGARGFGGGISNLNSTGTTTVTDSTFSGNSARNFGGGISNGFSGLGGTLNISNSTFSDNSAPSGAGIFHDSGTSTLRNTIVANSLTGGNCIGSITDGGGNLVWGDSTCPGINADPKLLALADNGGPTQTMALDSGSPALDAAVLANCPEADQRGVIRPQGVGCDIGAFELEQASDATAPTIKITTPVEGATYLLRQAVNANYACQDEDGGSGLASCVGSVASGSPIDTRSIGLKSFTVNTTDNAGNSASVTHSYSVVYNFGGFSQPVDSFPMVNSVKAGAGVPVKFSLGGYQGLNILAAGYPKIEFAACTGGSVDAVETTVSAGKSSLSYDASTNQYTYIWKTDKAWANKCGTLQVKFTDGTTQSILFKFSK